MSEKYLVNIADLDPSITYDRTFKLKNPLKIYIFLVLGVLCILIFRNLTAFIIGLLLISAPLINLFLIKDMVLAKTNDTHLLIYDVEDHQLAYRFSWDNITSYYIATNTMGTQVLVIELDDNSSVSVPLSSYGLMQQLKKKLPSKAKEIQMTEHIKELFRWKK